MTTIEQLEEFSRFTRQLVEAEGQNISLDVIFDRWRGGACRSDDLARIRAAVNDYENSDRGQPADDVIAGFRAERAGQ